MPKVVISDTSILILFRKIDEFELLGKVYGELITTPEIAEEFGETLPDWIKKWGSYENFTFTKLYTGIQSLFGWPAGNIAMEN